MKGQKLNDKIDEITQYLSELESIAPRSLLIYQENFEKRAACERYFEKIVEALIDLAFMVIKIEGLPLPEEERETFTILVEENIISFDLARRLKDAKGMRNILAHQYGSVDDSVVFTSITTELQNDTKEFLFEIQRLTSIK